MLFGGVFDRFAAESPVSVTAHATFEHALSADAVDELFAAHAERQYTRELLFSQLVDPMGLAECRVQPPLNAAIRTRGPKGRMSSPGPRSAPCSPDPRSEQPTVVRRIADPVEESHQSTDTPRHRHLVACVHL